MSVRVDPSRVEEMQADFAHFGATLSSAEAARLLRDDDRRRRRHRMFARWNRVHRAVKGAVLDALAWVFGR